MRVSEHLHILVKPEPSEKGFRRNGKGAIAMPELQVTQGVGCGWEDGGWVWRGRLLVLAMSMGSQMCRSLGMEGGRVPMGFLGGRVPAR